MPNINKFPEMVPDQFFVDIARAGKSSKWMIDGVIMEFRDESIWLGARIKFFDGYKAGSMAKFVVRNAAEAHQLKNVYIDGIQWNYWESKLIIPVIKLDPFTRVVFEQELLSYQGRMVKNATKKSTKAC